MANLVSVIIPAYNASAFILETVHSVLNQSYASVEVVIINDGSTDDTEEVLNKINDNRVVVFHRSNHGVSASRNFGLEKAKGEYVVFFDADDLMTPDFIKSRVEFLINNPFFSFVCSWVQKIDEAGNNVDVLMKSACNDLQNEILLYHAGIITCPGGYLFNKQDLLDNKLAFDETLSSAADRYFLLQIDKKIKGHFLLDDKIVLKYRIRNESMSNRLSEALIKDNELFYHYVINVLKPSYRVRKLFLSKSNYILFGAYYKTGRYFLSVKFAIVSFFIDPINFIQTVFKRSTDTFYFQ
jgi:glycosyltransferase involved in cell wall biosynthesis